MQHIKSIRPMITKNYMLCTNKQCTRLHEDLWAELIKIWIQVNLEQKPSPSPIVTKYGMS